MHIQLLVALLLALILSGCSCLYCGAMEQAGIHKRAIMVDRVKAARLPLCATKSCS